ncbi:MAG: LamG-like jellyroll fold domain-containing protein, partial [Bacillota bacterium]
MNKKLFTLIIFGILLLSSLLVFAEELTEFTNGLTSENLSFAGDENITRNISINKWVNISSVNLNLEGFNNGTSGVYTSNNFININEDNLWSLPGAEFRGTNAILDELNDTSTEKILTFSGDENQTTYLNIPKYAQVNDAFMNLSGFEEISTSHSDAYSCNGIFLSGHPCGDSVDENYSTYAEHDETDSIVYENYSINPSITSGNISSKIGHSLDGVEFDYTFCWNSSGWEPVIKAYSEDAGVVSYTEEIPSSCLNNGDNLFRVKTELNYCFICSGRVYRYYEGNVTWNQRDNSNNSYLEVGTPDGNYEWNQTEELNSTNSPQQTDNFSSSINTYLSSCSEDSEGICQVPLLFHSDSAGLLQTNNININYSNISNVRSDLFSNSLNDILNNTKEPTGACDGGTIDGENCIIPFKFHSDSSGTLEYSDLNVKYDITDVKPPQFTTIPDDEIIEYGNDWVGADFDAEDEGVGIDEWFINDSRFDINQSGYLDTEILGAGTYNVNVSVNDTIGYTNSTIYTLTVERKDLNITADDKTKTYGDSDPSNSVTYSGFVLEDDETNLDGSLNYNRESGEDVGNYDIQPSGQTADNYTLNYYNGTLTINQYPIEITADDKSKTYGESDPELTNTITSGSLQYDDSVIGDLNRDSGEAVGGYNINQGTLNINDGNNGENYDLSFVTGVLTINKAIPSLFLSSPNLISQYLFNNQTELSDNTGRNSGTLHVDATAYYPFNGNSNDESDNSNDGTVNGATLTTDRFGNSDKAYSFDGEDDYVEVSDDDSLDLDSGSFTISYWAYAKDFSGFTRSIDKEDGSNGYAVYHSGDSSSGSYLFSINENNDYRVSTKPLNTFEWHFVTFVYNSPENKLYSYLDGDAKETKTSIPNPNPSTAKLYIGAEDTTDDFFNGSIDEVMILDRPLTDEEVKSLYNITGGRDKFFIKSNAHYPFNGNANDSKGNNDGIVDESYTSLATDRFGESNKSYELDDTDELNKIYIPSSEDKWESGDLTFSIWFKPTNLKQNQYLWDKYNWRFEFSSSHQLRFTIGRCDDPLAGPSYSITSTTTLQNNRWYHATGVYHPDNDTGNGYIKLYLDGDLEDTEDIGSSEIHPDYGNDDLQWGNSMHGHALPFEGSVDESMIFENMLDDTEVQELYNQTNNSYLERESHDLNDIYVDGKVGQGAELWGGGGMQGEDKGKSSYIELDDDLDMPKNNHSLSFWYKTDYDEKKQALFQKTLYSYAGRITLKEDGKIHVESFTNNKWQSDFDTGINPQDGEFHHYSFVFSDTDTKLYVDGELADTQSANDDPDSDIFRYRLFGGSGQEISNYGNGATGTFDDIRIYNKTVSETEVKSIYNNNNGTEATEITAYPNSFSLTSSENNAGDGNSVYNLFVDGNLVDSGNLINYENLKGANTYEIEYNTTGNENYTSNSISSSLLINKGNPIASLTNDRSWSFTYDTTLANIGVSESNIGDGDLNYDIWKDNVNVGSGDSEATAGNYNYKINTTGGVNWSSADNMDANILNISKAIPSLTLSVTNSTYPNNFSINISEDNLGDEDLDYKLFIEDDNVINSSSATYEDLLSVGIYNIKYNTSGGQNYTSNSLTDSFTINKGPTNIDISFDGNGTAVTNNNYTIEAG